MAAASTMRVARFARRGVDAAKNGRGIHPSPNGCRDLRL
jgi:hypothetical protein